MELRFYLDEHIPLSIARQLRLRGITVLTVRDLGLLGDSDVNHLMRATAMNAVLCTYDDDYVVLAAQGIEHAGIIFGQQDRQWIGNWVNMLMLFHAVYTQEEMVNRVEYLPGD